MAATDSSSMQYLPFPNGPELNNRLRRLVTSYQRNFKKEEARIAQKARHQQRIERIEKFEAVMRAREMKKREQAQVKWSRREEADFYRIVSSFGVDYHRKTETFDWGRFRMYAKLERKLDETLTEYFKAFYAMCKKVVGRHLTEDEENLPISVDPITEEKANRCLARIDLLSKVREEIIFHPELDERMKLCQSQLDLPDWWVCGKHDKDLLLGVAKYGFFRLDFNLMNDPELSFMEVVRSYEVPAPLDGSLLGRKDQSCIDVETEVKPPTEPEATIVSSSTTTTTLNCSGLGAITATPLLNTSASSSSLMQPRGSFKWPRDRVLQLRLENICVAVEKNEWPIFRGLNSIMQHSTTPSIATADSSPRPSTPCSLSSASQEHTPHPTPDHTPRRESQSPFTGDTYTFYPNNASGTGGMGAGATISNTSNIFDADTTRPLRDTDLFDEKSSLLLNSTLQFAAAAAKAKSGGGAAGGGLDQQQQGGSKQAGGSGLSGPPPAHQSSSSRNSHPLSSLDLTSKFKNASANSVLEKAALSAATAAAAAAAGRSSLPYPAHSKQMNKSLLSDKVDVLDLSSMSSGTGAGSAKDPKAALSNFLSQNFQKSSSLLAAAQQAQSNMQAAAQAAAAQAAAAQAAAATPTGGRKGKGRGGMRIDQLALNLHAKKMQQETPDSMPQTDTTSSPVSLLNKSQAASAAAAVAASAARMNKSMNEKDLLAALSNLGSVMDAKKQPSRSSKRSRAQYSESASPMEQSESPASKRAMLSAVSKAQLPPSLDTKSPNFSKYLSSLLDAKNEPIEAKIKNLINDKSTNFKDFKTPVSMPSNTGSSSSIRTRTSDKRSATATATASPSASSNSFSNLNASNLLNSLSQAAASSASANSKQQQQQSQANLLAAYANMAANSNKSSTANQFSNSASQFANLGFNPSMFNANVFPSMKAIIEAASAAAAANAKSSSASNSSSTSTSTTSTASNSAANAAAAAAASASMSSFANLFGGMNPLLNFSSLANLGQLGQQGAGAAAKKADATGGVDFSALFANANLAGAGDDKAKAQAASKVAAAQAAALQAAANAANSKGGNKSGLNPAAAAAMLGSSGLAGSLPFLYSNPNFNPLSMYNPLGQFGMNSPFLSNPNIMNGLANFSNVFTSTTPTMSSTSSNPPSRSSRTSTAGSRANTKLASATNAGKGGSSSTASSTSGLSLSSGLLATGASGSGGTAGGGGGGGGSGSPATNAGNSTLDSEDESMNGDFEAAADRAEEPKAKRSRSSKSHSAPQKSRRSK
ncbi:choline dehydrogenase 7 [Tyrophagus putrescentiae]|nr:choline dehydrogenase 7 [Tyrophagus putrescentiae]